METTIVDRVSTLRHSAGTPNSNLLVLGVVQQTIDHDRKQTIFGRFKEMLRESYSDYTRLTLSVECQPGFSRMRWLV